jgi:hypothetical protein
MENLRRSTNNRGTYATRRGVMSYGLQAAGEVSVAHIEKADRPGILASMDNVTVYSQADHDNSANEEVMELLRT